MWIEVILGLLGLFGLLYFYITKDWNYWTKRNVFQIEPSFPFGSLSCIFTLKEHLLETMERHAKEAENFPYYGEYFLGSPVLVIKDVDLVRQITVKDFDHFVDRNFAQLAKVKDSVLRTDKIWMAQMTSAEGDQWKGIRSTFTPIFTSGKMKAMLVFMQDTCNRLIEAMDANAEQGTDFELKEILGKYSMDTIASCAFGVDSQAFSNDKSKFVEYASSIFKQTTKDGLKFAALFLPFNIGFNIFQALKIPFFQETETEFFYSVVVDSLKHRRESKTRRNDLIDLMMDAIKGQVQADQDEHQEQFEKDAAFNHKKKEQFDELVVVATAIVILVAGYDTTGTTLAFACYQLAKNQEIQDKLFEEVNALGLDNDQELSYEDLSSMTYVDQVISETLRFHNPAPATTRICTKDYKMPGENGFEIKPGQAVWINTVAIHNNPEHYANPYEFDPEHFSKEAKAKRNPYAYLPFGQGPRGCIGMRFALLEAKLALANIVRRFRLMPSDKTKEPLVLDPASGITYVKDGLFVKVEKRL